MPRSTRSWRTGRGRLRRRELLAGGAGLALAAALGGRLPRAIAASAPRIVVVGGGLAGLTCAYRLKQAGYRADLYEASDRLGGRCWTRRGDFAEGQIAEHGGELIDQGHTQTRQLAQELGLDLDNLLSAELNGAEPFYYFDGAALLLRGGHRRPEADLAAAAQRRLRRELPDPLHASTQRGRELDAMSIADWIQSLVPGGMKSKLGQLLDIAYNIEYGAETNVQSSLNMLYLLGFAGPGQLRIFGESNEKYHVRGGNDQIPTRLANALAGQINTGSELVAIRRNADGSYRLTFHSGSGTSTVTADRVVLALPFSILRGVDYSKAGFSQVKNTAIQELGMGTNSKLHVQFTSRFWNSLGNQGKPTRTPATRTPGRSPGRSRGPRGSSSTTREGTSAPASAAARPTERAKQFLAQIEPVLPGISSRWNGRATVDYWTGYEWTKGSYSYWKVGQYTKFAGAERQAEGACHFAGEHTSIDSQGYLNGAVESGERAVEEILAALK